MKRALALLTLLFSTGWLVFFHFLPDLDKAYPLPLFHFYVVTFFTFTAMISAFLINITLAADTTPRHRLLASAFTTMAAIFFIHGICTPGAIIATFNPGIQWGAWLTLFTGGLLFTLATVDHPNKPMANSTIRSINQTITVFYIIFALIVAFTPNWLTMINNWANPFHIELVFWSSLVLWGYAAVRLFQLWRQTHDSTDGLMALIAAWLFLATISMHRFPVWQLSWWLYHILLLVGALVAVYALTNRYERIRQFHLTTYYVALGTVVTAFLSLLAAYFLSQAVTNNLIATTESDITVILARRLGLLITAGTMGTLFGTLFIIVRRADQLITNHTTELATAYANLQASESLRDELTDMVIHDLRTPLTTTRLSLGLLIQSFNDPDKESYREEFITRVRSSLDRMLNLINQLLDTAKLEAGKFQLNLTTISLPEFLQECVTPFQLQAEDNNITLAIDTDPTIPNVSLDASLVRRVLDNLLSNAFKYTSNKDHITITASIQNNALLIQIRDSGIGIPSENLENIFAKFVQVTDEKGQSIRKGTGLGLAFCKLVVEAHNGRIWAENTPGAGGSTFSFTIPQ